MLSSLPSGRPACSLRPRPGAVVLAVVALTTGLVGLTSAAAQPPPPVGARGDDADPPAVTISGALRIRPEGRRDVGFDPAVDRGYLLSRLRVRLTARLSADATTVVELQDSRAPGLRDASPSLRDPLDLHQGYLELGRPQTLVRLRVGRQEMPYGAERLLSRNNWRNTARSFDAVRLFLDTPAAGVDLFAAAEVRREPTGFNPFDELGDLYGAYGRVSVGPDGYRLEPYVLRRSLPIARDRDQPTGVERRQTIGVRLVRPRDVGLDLVTELAWQRGRLGPRRIDAWFATAIVTYTLDVTGHPRLMFEATEASGDDDAADGRSATFDPMFPTGHAHFGFADIFSGRNLRDLRVGVAWAPTPRSTIRVDAHNFWASNPADGLYAPSLSLVVTPSGVGRPTRVGSELNLTLRVRLHRQLLVGGGYGHLFSGPFLRDTTAGGVARYPYGLVEIDF